MSLSLRLFLTPLSVYFMRRQVGPQIYTGEYLHLVDNVYFIMRCAVGQMFIVCLCPGSDRVGALICFVCLTNAVITLNISRGNMLG